MNSHLLIHRLVKDQVSDYRGNLPRPRATPPVLPTRNINEAAEGANPELPSPAHPLPSQPIAQLRDPRCREQPLAPYRISSQFPGSETFQNKFLASRAEKSAIVRVQSARKGPRCRKKCDRASFSPLKTRTIALFSAAAALFPKRTGQPRPRRSEETFPEPAPCEAPPQARLRMRPPDTSRRHTLRAHLTNAPSENARENGRDDVSAPARARPNDAGDARASGQATFARRFGQPRAAAQCIG